MQKKIYIYILFKTNFKNLVFKNFNKKLNKKL